MALRLDNNFGLFSGGSGGGGGGGGIQLINVTGLCGIGITGSPIVAPCGTLGICNTLPYTGQAVEILGSGTCSTFRCAVNNLSSGACSASLGGSYNCATSNFGTIVGGSFNTVSGYASFIGGGANNLNASAISTIGGGIYNTLCNNSQSIFGNTIGGGIGNNTTGGTFCCQLGLFTAAPTAVNVKCYSFIGGGFQNTTLGNYNTIGGGVENDACADYGFIGGGSNNCTINDFSTIGGGATNRTCGDFSTIVGGRINITRSAYAVITGGCANCIQSNATGAVIGGGFVNCVVEGNYTYIGGGCRNKIDTNGGDFGVITGGYANIVCCNASSSVIGGGQNNITFDDTSIINGGIMNLIGDTSQSPYPLCCTDPISATQYIYLCGDATGQIVAGCSVGYYHSIDARVYIGLVTSSTYIGGANNYTQISGICPGSIKVTNGFLRDYCAITSSNSEFSIIGGGYLNTIDNGAKHNTISNGYLNSIQNNVNYGYIGNGKRNCLLGSTSCMSHIMNGTQNYLEETKNSTILNGSTNSAYNSCNLLIGNGTSNCIGNCANYPTILNGCQNRTSGYASFIGTGICNNLYDNTASGYNCLESLASVIVGGVGNNTCGGTFNTTTLVWDSAPTRTTPSCFSFIGGGFQNILQSCYSSIVGGYCNINELSPYSFIGGGFNNALCSSANSVVGGGVSHSLNAGCSNFIGGGQTHQIGNTCFGVVVGGQTNTLNSGGSGGFSSHYSFIGGGSNNTISAVYNSVIGGGVQNCISNDNTPFSYNVIGGGCANAICGTASGYDAQLNIIGGGFQNLIRGQSCYSSILGGQNNIICDKSNVHILGSNITVSGAYNRANATYVENLNIVDTPSGSNTADVLAWDSFSGEVVIKNGGVGLTSVGVTSLVPAFTILNSPITTSSANNFICICGNGLASQYIRGDGTLATFPVVSGGGGGATYYFNGNISVASPSGKFQLSRTANFGTQCVFCNGLCADNTPFVSFITCTGDPNLTCLPGGIWEYSAYMCVHNGNSACVSANVFKWCQNLGSCSTIGTGQPVQLTDGQTLSLYAFSTAIPSTSLATNDRLGVDILGQNTGGKIVYFATEGSTLAAVQTTISTGISSLNGLNASSQLFTCTTDGTNFSITSSGCTHCFNLPTASATNRGALSSADWSRFNGCLSPTFPANSFYVNNTGTSATAISAVYCESGNISMLAAPFNGTILWCTTAGATIPTGTCANLRILRVGNLVTLNSYVCFTSPPTAITICGFELQFDTAQLSAILPAPAAPTYITTQNCAVVAIGGAYLNVGSGLTAANATKVALTVSSTSTGIYSICYRNCIAYSNLCRNYAGTISYITNSAT